MPDPNNIVIREYKTIGMLIPKAANESVKYAFMNLLGLKGKVRKAFDTFHKEHIHKLNEWFRFSFVRNPFDRLVSCWFDKTQGKEMFYPFVRDFGMKAGIPFDAFVNLICEVPDKKANQHWRRQTYDLMLHDVLIPDFIGRYERINEDWQVIQEHVKGLPDLPHVNKSDHAPYRDYYTPRLRDMVSERYAQDLKTLNYQF